jgi:hypothetical protein
MKEADLLPLRIILCLPLVWLILTNVASGAEEQKPIFGETEISDTNNNLPAAEPRRDRAVTLFVGQLTSKGINKFIPPMDQLRFVDSYFVGAAYSQEFWRNDYLAFELEGGLGHMWGSQNDTSQVWGAAYLRYHNFPWNHFVKTSIAASIGVNYAFNHTKVETDFSFPGQPQKMLHYYSPEITFAHPDYDDIELVARIHHRSPVWGLFGCEGCGSNTLAIGIRKRF